MLHCENVSTKKPEYHENERFSGTPESRIFRHCVQNSTDVHICTQSIFTACTTHARTESESKNQFRCSTSHPLHANETVRGTGLLPVRYWLIVRRVNPIACAACVKDN